MGIATGAGVVIAQYFGSKDIKKMRIAIHNSLALNLIMSVLLTAFGLIFAEPLLHIIGVPQDIFDLASLYLKIYFLGLIFMLIYNMGSGILRAIGDSKRPLYFLIFSSFMNIILDFLFVRGFHLGVAGVGYATLIAQAISASLVLFILMHTQENYCVVLKEIKIDRDILLSILKIGIPTGLQQSIVSLSNVIVQSYINNFGSSVIAGYSVTLKIDGFLNMPLQAFNMAITTFVSQNIGAKQFDRIKKGAFITNIIATLSIGLYVFLVAVYGREIVALFTNDKSVIDVGRYIQHIFLPFYLFLPSVHVISGVLRGAGKSTTAMYIMLFSFVVFRQLYLIIISRLTTSSGYIFFGWPSSWIVCSVIFIIYYFKVPWLKIKEK